LLFMGLFRFVVRRSGRLEGRTSSQPLRRGEVSRLF
jgi:hypothetical protein